MTIRDASRIQVTTFGSDDPAQVTVEWVVSVSDTRIGFWTPNTTTWTTRLAASPVVTVRQCNAFGKVDREEPLFEGRAEVVTEGELFTEVRQDTRGKYALGAAVAGLIDKVSELGGEKTPEGVVIINIVG